MASIILILSVFIFIVWFVRKSYNNYKYRQLFKLRDELKFYWNLAAVAVNAMENKNKPVEVIDNGMDISGDKWVK